jgi:hypothetical protein
VTSFSNLSEAIVVVIDQNVMAILLGHEPRLCASQGLIPPSIILPNRDTLHLILA